MKNFFFKIFKNRKSAKSAESKNEPNQQSEIKNLSRPVVDQKSSRSSRMLDDVCAFLARYLHCSPEQRTVLALWVLHTHSFAAARATPYLAIQSSRKLSGKSLCLRLLSLLSAHPELTSGYTASALVNRIHSHPNELPTFLLDESPSTVGSRSRAKNPKLRAILVSGFQPGIGYSDRSFECTIFSPKAFASLGPLPEALADCSIPILLETMQNPEQFGIERFDLSEAQQEAQPLVAALQNWSRKNISALKSAPAFKYKDFPQRLTWRGQDLVEPLLQLADQVGGDYPTRARQALLHVFDDPARQQQDIANQLLRDLRDCFQFHGNPERIATAVFLEWLHGLPSRPWDIDGPITGRKFANLLAPFALRPRFQRMGKTSSARGYQLKDFVPLWQKHLDNSENRVAQPPSAVGVSTNNSDATKLSAAKDSGVAVASTQQPKANSEESISPNKDEACSAVAHSGTHPEISANQRESAAKDSGVDVGVEVSQEPRANSQEPASWLPPILMPSDWACYNFDRHSAREVEIIRHFSAQGYRAVGEREVRLMEFSCGNVPFAPVYPRTSSAYPAKPVRSLKRAEPLMTDAERAAAWEKIRRDRDAPPKCAQRENFRLAPQQRR